LNAGLAGSLARFGHGIRPTPHQCFQLGANWRQTSLVAHGHGEQSYFLRKRSSLTTSPPLAGLSGLSGLPGFSRLAEGVAAAGLGSGAGSDEAAGAAAGRRFFLAGSCTFAGTGLSSPSTTSSNWRPN